MTSRRCWRVWAAWRPRLRRPPLPDDPVTWFRSKLKAAGLHSEDVAAAVGLAPSGLSARVRGPYPLESARGRRGLQPAGGGPVGVRPLFRQPEGRPMKSKTKRPRPMVKIGQSQGELMQVLTSKYTGGIRKMQDEKKPRLHQRQLRLFVLNLVGCGEGRPPYRPASFSVSWSGTWHCPRPK